MTTLPSTFAFLSVIPPPSVGASARVLVTPSFSSVRARVVGCASSLSAGFVADCCQNALGQMATKQNLNLPGDPFENLLACLQCMDGLLRAICLSYL